MAPKKYLKLDTSTGRATQESAVDSSAGAGDAGKIVALDSGGMIDITMLPVGTEAQTFTAVGSITAGDWVNTFDNSGTASARKALATDDTKPATGYVLDSVADGETVTVYSDGVNSKVPVGSFVAADVGKRVFLSASVSGATTLTPPSSSGNLVQKVGTISSVGGTYISVNVDFGDEFVA